MSVPPPSSPPPAAEPPPGPELEFALEERGLLRRNDADRLTLGKTIVLEHGRMLGAPLELPLAAIKVATVDQGPAKASGNVGRFPILRRIGPNAVVPRTEGIDGWLWTGAGGTALTSMHDADTAPNVALMFTKPLDERKLMGAFLPDVLQALAARSPLGNPAVLGVLLRLADPLAAANGFRRWGFQDLLTDRDVPPTMRRHLPDDRPADPKLGGGDPDAARAATSVAPPGSS